MASTYSTSLQIQLVGNGEQSGVWGTTTNTNWNLIEQAVAGVQSITMLNANYTLSVANGISDEARNMVLNVGGTNSAIRQIIAPLVPKVYVVFNNTSGGYAITIGGATGAVVTIPTASSSLVFCDGTNFYSGISAASGNFTIPGNNVVAGNETVGGNLSVTGTSTLSGNVTAPTQASSDNSTKVATTAFVGTAITNATASLGTMSTQNANNVNITGGTINAGSIASPVRPLQVSGTTSAESTLYVSSGLADNRIWNFLVACTAGTASGFQIRKLNDAGSVGTTAFSIDSSLNAAVAGSMTATSFSGAGTGLTGTANSLNAGLGVNQSYYNVTGSRSSGVTYTNSTSKPIFVSVYGGGAGELRAYVNGLQVQISKFINTNTNCNVAFIVPNGATYSVVATNGINYWTELS